MSLVIWILGYRCRLKALKCYMDDVLSIGMVMDVCWYEWYQQVMPTDHAKVL